MVLHSSTAETPLLRISGVSVRFGAIAALSDISFEVGEREILGLIGPNGAGKTTLFNCLSRIVEVDAGSIELGGAPLAGVPRHAIARYGIGRTFQHVALFDSMSVVENVMVGAHVLGRGGFLADALRLPGLVRGEREARRRAAELMERLQLAELAEVAVGRLPFAVRKRVELARALAGQPRLLLLDEPAGGLNHEEVEQLIELIRAVRADFGVAILLVEHHLDCVMRVSDRVVALDFGKLLASGTPAEMRRHPEVIRAYLGVSESSSESSESSESSSNGSQSSSERSSSERSSSGSQSSSTGGRNRSTRDPQGGAS